MIWTDGRIVPDDAVGVSVRDRTFEHGLGLFETLRTWDRRPLLLPRHLARLSRSAGELGIPIEPGAFPDVEAIRALLDADGIPGDALVRLTLSGSGVLWMRSGPLPPPPGPEVKVSLDPLWRVSEDDPTLRHKMLNYWTRRSAWMKASAAGFDEIASTGQGGVLWEGSRTNLFVIGEAGEVVTPSLDGPILPGVMRGLVLELANRHSLPILEPQGLAVERLRRGTEFFLTNAVRGIIPVAVLGDQIRVAPGPWTARLQASVSRWLASEDPSK